MDLLLDSINVPSSKDDYTVEPIAQSAGGNIQIDIVFVHGLTNTWSKTWASEAQSPCWIEESLLLEIPNVQIWTCGFDVRSFISKEPNDFSNHSFTLFKEFEKRRKPRPVIFVAHSLGGLILQAFLIRCSESTFQSVHGILFFATPNHGLHEKSWAQFFTSTSGIMDREPMVRPSMSQHISELNDKFLNFLKQEHQQTLTRKVVCLYETEPAAHHGIVVLEQSAAVLENCDSIAVHADHFSISKITTQSSVQYQSVMQVFRSMYCLAESSLSVFLRHSIGAYSHGRLRNLPSTPDLCEEFLASTKGSIEAQRLGRTALVYEDQGCYKDAELNYRRAADLFKESPGPSHGVTLFLFDKLSGMKRNNCKYADAQILSSECLKQRILVSGKHTLPTMRSAGNLALAMRFQGKHNDAYSLLRDALENVKLTASSPRMVPHVHLINILAKVVMDCKMFDIALFLFGDVVQMAVALYGTRHPYTLNRISDLAVVTALRGHMPGAEAISRYALNGLEQALGTDHLHCLKTARRLADFIRSQERLREANAQLKKILEIQNERPGPFHPETLSTMSSLGAVYAQQGYFVDAEVVLRQALESQRTYLPEHHAGIKWTQHALENLKTSEKRRVSNGRKRVPPSLKFIEPKFDSIPSQTFQKDHYNSSAFEDGVAEQMIRAAIKIDNIKADELLRTAFHDQADSPILGRALREAAANQNEELVLSLLEFGVNVNATGEFHGTALQAAASTGNAAIVRLLLGRRADLNIYGGIFGNALRAAIVGRHRDTTQLLLDHHPKQEILDSSLAVAVMTRQLDIVCQLLKKGADVNAKDHLFGSPLQQASFSGEPEIVTLLLNHQADVNSKGGLFGSPLEAAITTNQKAITHRLLDAKAETPGPDAFGGYKLRYEARLREILFERHQKALIPEATSTAVQTGEPGDTPGQVLKDRVRPLATQPATHDSLPNAGTRSTDVVYPPLRKNTRSGFTTSSSASRASRHSIRGGIQTVAKQAKQVKEKLSSRQKSLVRAQPSCE